MFLMNCLSHGTQDLYPDFLKHGHSIAPNTVAYVTMFYNVGAVLGAVLFGLLSERIGRRHSMLAALGLALLVIPAWAFGSTLAVLALGAFVLQMGVQGAWGNIPIHLNELSPDAVRGLLPGFTYQIGILLAASTPTVEFALRDHLVCLGTDGLRTRRHRRVIGDAVLRPGKAWPQLYDCHGQSCCMSLATGHRSAGEMASSEPSARGASSFAGTAAFGGSGVSAG